MGGMTDRDKSEYYHRCYKAVDGLWFVKSEERYGFDAALELDLDVWKVMPRIQSRFLRKKLGTGYGLEALRTCLSRKLDLDGFKFQIREHTGDDCLTGLEFNLSVCPWHEILIRSKRQHLSDKIGSVICSTEYGVWASEFGDDIAFGFGNKRICRGASCCILFFSRGR